MHCAACHEAPVPSTHRLYCPKCSPRASALWKRRHREEWRREWLAAGRTGPDPALDSWESPDARRAWHAAYMRNWRARKRLPPNHAAGTQGTAKSRATAAAELARAFREGSLSVRGCVGRRAACLLSWHAS